MVRRFQNILVVFDLAYGGDETLERALELVDLNDADLTILHIVGQNKASSHLIEERMKLMNRLTSGINLENEKRHVVVESGERVALILETIETREIDLVVLPTEYDNALSQLMGTDTVAELMRFSPCPIWVVRPERTGKSKKIVAALNAGKANSMLCPANKRILEMSSSLAVLEGADLDVLYAYQYSKEEERIVHSDASPSVRSEVMKKAYARGLTCVTKVMNHIYDSSLHARPVALQGDAQDVIVDYLKETNADLLVIEEKPESPLVTALVGNPILRLLHEAGCAVLISRPNPEYGVKSDRFHSKDARQKAPLN